MRRKELIDELYDVWNKLFMLTTRAPRHYKKQVRKVFMAVQELLEELEERE